ncbi:MAG TPA: hypothetical protein VHR66_33065 [Gemmataceae bacterium]|jgi:hypothetical protein|nr:hypothetical protein [Gemmataceae bacterium]
MATWRQTYLIPGKPGVHVSASTSPPDSDSTQPTLKNFSGDGGSSSLKTSGGGTSSLNGLRPF